MGQPEATAFNGVCGMTLRDVTPKVKNRISSEGFYNLGTRHLPHPQTDASHKRGT